MLLKHKDEISTIPQAAALVHAADDACMSHCHTLNKLLYKPLPASEIPAKSRVLERGALECDAPEQHSRRSERCRAEAALRK